MLKDCDKNGKHKVISQKTGQVKLIKHYKNGFIHGPIIYYWDNGQIRLKGNYNKMHRTGIWKMYDESGKLILKENYDYKNSINDSQLSTFNL